MKKLIIAIFTLFITFSGIAQTKPTTNFKQFYNPQFWIHEQKDPWIYAGQSSVPSWIKLFTAKTTQFKIDSLATASGLIYKLIGDSINLKGYFTQFDALSKPNYSDLLRYRQLSNHDSLSTLQEKNYSSLDGKPDLTVYRTLSNHDSLSTLQEKNYSSLDNKPDLSIYLEASDIAGKKDISDSTDATGYTRRDRLASELAKKENNLTKGNLTESIAGLQFDATRQVIGGTADLQLSSGYAIPTTTNIQHGETAYDEMYKVAISGNPNEGYLSPVYFNYDSGSGTIMVTTTATPSSDSPQPFSSGGAYTELAGKQATLVSGVNIKTINNQPITGSGNLNISTGTTDHSALINLSYAASGHTGFAAINGSLSEAFNVSSLTVESGTYDWTVSGSSGTLTFSQYGGDISFASGGITAEGPISCSEGYRGSSRTLKHNIRDFNRSALDIILNTKIQEYNLNVDSSYGVGFIAENTDTILSGNDQKKHLFGNHLSVLTKALQEQQAQIELLKTKNKNRTKYEIIAFIIVILFFFVRRTNK